jgi:hypothetical protein
VERLSRITVRVESLIHTPSKIGLGPQLWIAGLSLPQEAKTDNNKKHQIILMDRKITKGN